MTPDRWLARVQKEIFVEVSGAGVERVGMLRRGKGKSSAEVDPPLARRAWRELAEYLRGKRKAFGLPLALSSLPPFFQKILREAANIPYGETRSYGWLAARAGRWDRPCTGTPSPSSFPATGWWPRTDSGASPPDWASRGPSSPTSGGTSKRKAHRCGRSTRRIFRRSK